MSDVYRRFKPLMSMMQVESKIKDVKKGFERAFDGYSKSKNC